MRGMANDPDGISNKMIDIIHKNPLTILNTIPEKLIERFFFPEKYGN